MGMPRPYGLSLTYQTNFHRANFRLVDRVCQAILERLPHVHVTPSPCSRHALRAWALNDLACMATTRNASGNKGVLHTLEADCPEAQVHNLCVRGTVIAKRLV